MVWKMALFGLLLHLSVFVAVTLKTLKFVIYVIHYVFSSQIQLINFIFFTNYCLWFPQIICLISVHTRHFHVKLCILNSVVSFFTLFMFLRSVSWGVLLFSFHVFNETACNLMDEGCIINSFFICHSLFGLLQFLIYVSAADTMPALIHLTSSFRRLTKIHAFHKDLSWGSSVKINTCRKNNFKLCLILFNWTGRTKVPVLLKRWRPVK